MNIFDLISIAYSGQLINHVSQQKVALLQQKMISQQADQQDFLLLE
jgi:hypothetical protein